MNQRVSDKHKIFVSISGNQLYIADVGPSYYEFRYQFFRNAWRLVPCGFQTNLKETLTEKEVTQLVIGCSLTTLLISGELDDQLLEDWDDELCGRQPRH